MTRLSRNPEAEACAKQRPAHVGESEKQKRELSEKMKQMQKKHEEKLEDFQKKLKELQKQNLVLSKASKKNNNANNITPNDSPLL